VEVKIGVQYAVRELVLETNESSDVIEKAAAEAITGGSLLSLTDTKGRTVFVPGDKITYIELGTPTSNAVGFRG
jgi:hypothetical protein